MPSLSKPDGWDTDGVWGTDIDRTEGSANTYSGSSAVKMLSANAIDLHVEDPIMIEPLMTYALYAILKTNRNNVGDIISFYVDEYNADFAFISSNLVQTSRSRTVGSFEYLGGTFQSNDPLVRYIVPRITKTATAFTVIIDRVICERMPPLIQLRTASSTMIADGTLRSPTMTANADRSAAMMEGVLVGTQIKFFNPGMYLIEAQLIGEDFNSGDYLGMRLFTTGFTDMGFTGSEIFSQDIVPFYSDGISLRASTIGLFTGDAGGSPKNPGTVTLQYRANSVGSPSFANGSHDCYLRATRITYW